MISNLASVYGRMMSECRFIRVALEATRHVESHAMMLYGGLMYGSRFNRAIAHFVYAPQNSKKLTSHTG